MSLIKKDEIQLFVDAFEVAHGMIKSTAYRFDDIAYISDCNKIGDSVSKKLLNLKYLIIDCLRKEKHPSHFNLETSLTIIKKFKPKKAILTNLSPVLDYKVLKKMLPKNVIPAHDGLTINL